MPDRAGPERQRARTPPASGERQKTVRQAVTIARRRRRRPELSALLPRPGRQSCAMAWRYNKTPCQSPKVPHNVSRPDQSPRGQPPATCTWPQPGSQPRNPSEGQQANWGKANHVWQRNRQPRRMSPGQAAGQPLRPSSGSKPYLPAGQQQQSNRAERRRLPSTQPHWRGSVLGALHQGSNGRSQSRWRHSRTLTRGPQQSSRTRTPAEPLGSSQRDQPAGINRMRRPLGLLPVSRATQPQAWPDVHAAD